MLLGAYTVLEDWNFVEMIMRTTITFFVLLLMTRLMGGKQLSQLTFFNYITGIALGSIAAKFTSNVETNFLNGMTSLLWWSLLTLLIGYITMQSTRARRTIDGGPIIVIKQGKILEHKLKKIRLSIDDLSMLLREQQVFSYADVEMAVFESNGKLSIMLKEENLPVTKKDQQIRTIKPKYIPTALISDGKIIEQNLREAGLTHEWLQSQLSLLHTNLTDVFYLELQKDGSLYMDKRDDLPKA